MKAHSQNLLILSFLFFGLLLFGCDSGGAEEKSSLVGSHALISINGNSVPTESGDYFGPVESGALILRSDNTFSLLVEALVEADCVDKECRYTGEYAVSGEEINFVLLVAPDDPDVQDLYAQVQEDQIEVTLDDLGLIVKNPALPGGALGKQP